MKHDTRTGTTGRSQGAPAARKTQAAVSLPPIPDRKNGGNFLIVIIVVALLIIIMAVVLRQVSDNRTYNKYMEQASFYYQDCQYSTALTYLRKAYAVDETEDCLNMMVSCYDILGNYDKAIETLRRMDTTDPEIQARIRVFESRREVIAQSTNVVIGGTSYPGNTTGLVLDNGGYADSILTEAVQLYGLTNLSAAGNSIRDISPLGALGGLTSLNLSNNAISDISPLASLTNLRTLYLDNNPLTDLSPLFGLDNLTSLSIKGIAITESQLAKLSKELPNCAVHSETATTETQDISLGGITFNADVTELNLSGMGLENISAIAGCKKLVHIDLSNNNISDITPLMNIPGLRWLNLSGNQLGDVNPLMGITELAVLDLSNNSISNTAPLSRLVNLTQLSLDNNPIVNFSGLRKLNNLKILGLSSTGLHDSDLESLYSLTYMTELNIENNPDITAVGVGELGNYLTGCNITHSELVYYVDIDGVQVRGDMTELDLNGHNITDISNLSGMNVLERLSLGGNNISNISIFEGSGSRFTLRYLDLSSNQIWDISPLSGLSNLEELNLSNNQIDTISALSYLENLKVLYLGGNPVSEDQIIALQEALPELTIILD